MTARLPFTVASVKRLCEGCRRAGLNIVAVKPDGTIIVDDGKTVPESLETKVVPRSKWEDVEV